MKMTNWMASCMVSESTVYSGPQRSDPDCALASANSRIEKAIGNFIPKKAKLQKKKICLLVESEWR